jgi:hypothetical protein
VRFTVGAPAVLNTIAVLTVPVWFTPVTMLSLYALATPSDVLAADAVEAPVPPSAIAKSVIPTMLPPVTLMLVIVPKLVRDEAVTPDANVLPVRPLANAALAVPVRVAVIVPALKFPDASRATIADAVFALAAVVAELLTFSAVAIVSSLVSTIAALALMSAFTMTPEAIEVALPTLVTSPVRLALMVTAPAVKPAAVPVQFVRTPAEGVPRLGVTRTRELANFELLTPASLTMIAPEIVVLCFRLQPQMQT